jgi:hypothetical protein
MSGNELQRMEAIPNPLQLPNGDQVYGATAGWSNDSYRLVETSWDVPDPPLAPLALQPISDRQFFQALALKGVITTSEALAAVKTGTLPAKLQAALSTMPADQRFDAEMLLSGAVVFHRDAPMTNAMMTIMGWDAPSTDELWRYAATL